MTPASLLTYIAMVVMSSATLQSASAVVAGTVCLKVRYAAPALFSSTGFMQPEAQHDQETWPGVLMCWWLGHVVQAAMPLPLAWRQAQG